MYFMLILNLYYFLSFTKYMKLYKMLKYIITKNINLQTKAHYRQ